MSTALCFLLCLGFFDRGQAQQIPVCWSEALGLASLKDIPKKLEEPLKNPDGEGVTLGKGEKTVQLSTCSQYLDAIEKGFFAPTTLQEKHEDVFIARCHALHDLQSVHSATKSYFQRNGWSPAMFSELPLLFKMPGRTYAAPKALEGAETWQSVNPGLKLRGIDRDVLIAQDELRRYRLEILARGDFNDDGVEDLALSACVDAKHGTYHLCSFYLLTRHSENSIFQVVQEYGLR